MSNESKTIITQDIYIHRVIDIFNKENREREIKQACLLLFPIWYNSNLTENDLSITEIRGGITNQLYRVSHQSDSVLFRIYGVKTELIIDRDRENKVFLQLTQNQFGPILYGRVYNGRAEQWLSGHSLHPADMLKANLMPKIGSRLAQMHHLDLPFSREPLLWSTIEKWLNVAHHIQFEHDPLRKQKLQLINLSKLTQEITDLRTKLLAQAPSPIVFAHNDLLSGNIIYDPSQDQITFVDFEYSGYNYRAFDIANHFCECCGFDCDWSQFPTQQTQYLFLRGYLATSGQLPLDQVTDAQCLALYQEIQPWVLMPHLFWGIWAIVQARYSPIDFDFLSYSQQRIDGFYMMKERCYSFLK